MLARSPGPLEVSLPPRAPPRVLLRRRHDRPRSCRMRIAAQAGDDVVDDGAVPDFKHTVSIEEVL